MKSRHYYITILSALFLFAFVIFIAFTTNWHHLNSAALSVVFIIYFSWQAIKKYKERNQKIVYDYRRILAALGLALLMAGLLIFAGTILKSKPLTPAQKEKLIVK
ncbi:MAG: hypothetical protein JSS98_08685 [Bacteroidetes bacterium]|nr:hypothetical protein [Bacteroidota bacterium]